MKIKVTKKKKKQKHLENSSCVNQYTKAVAAKIGGVSNKLSG